MKREIDSIHVNRDTAHARCVIRTDFHGIGHPALSLVISWCVCVCGVPVTRQKRNGGCPPKKHPWESPDRAAERENIQTRRRPATKKNSDVDQLLKISRCSGPAMNVPPLVVSNSDGRPTWLTHRCRAVQVTCTVLHKHCTVLYTSTAVATVNRCMHCCDVPHHTHR